MKKIKLPTVRQFGYDAQGTLLDGERIYHYVRVRYGAYFQRRCFVFPIYFERKFGAPVIR